MYILSSVFTTLCAVVLPITVTVILCVKNKKIWLPILMGTLTFVVFQVLIRIPIIQALLPQTAWYIAMQNTQPIIYALFLGSTAALFEEGGRFLVMSLFLKKHRDTLDGIAFGVGHGGIEAILLAGINAIIMLLSPTELATSSLIFASGVERLSAMTMQIAFSVLVMKSVREKKWSYLLIAFLLHTLIDFGAVLAVSSLGIWPLEIVMLFVAAIMAWFVVKEYKKKTEI